MHGDHTPFFWRLLAIRLSFVIVFEVRPFLFMSNLYIVSRVKIPFDPKPRECH